MLIELPLLPRRRSWYVKPARSWISQERSTKLNARGCLHNSRNSSIVESSRPTTLVYSEHTKQTASSGHSGDDASQGTILAVRSCEPADWTSPAPVECIPIHYSKTSYSKSAGASAAQHLILRGTARQTRWQDSQPDSQISTWL